MTSDPNSPQYDWIYHRRARERRARERDPGPDDDHHARPVLLDDQPEPLHAARPCTVAPKIGEFGDFAAAVTKRYAGKVDYYSIGNEFNLGKNWLTPRFKRSGRTKYDFGAAVYRKMWIAGQRAIARYDPSRRNRVLFAETAADRLAAAVHPQRALHRRQGQGARRASSRGSRAAAAGSPS